MFTVTFEQYLHVSMLDYINEHVRQTCLHRRMQVQFRLLKDYRRTFWHIVAKHQHGQDLGDSDAHIGYQRFRTIISSL